MLPGTIALIFLITYLNAKILLKDLTEEMNQEERLSKNNAMDSTKILEGKRILDRFCKRENKDIYRELEVK